MVEMSVIQRVGRGVFVLGKTKKFNPEISTDLKEKYYKLKNIFPFVSFCVWNTSIFNEFSLHQSNINFTIIETEKDVIESVFFSLKEIYMNVFLNPEKELLERYVYDIPNAIIVKPLVTESPLQKINNIQSITIEKLLVDLFCDVDFLSLFQGNEKNIIYKEAFKKYTINNSKLLRYASRRGKKNEIEEYIINSINNTK